MYGGRFLTLGSCQGLSTQMHRLRLSTGISIRLFHHCFKLLMVWMLIRLIPLRSVIALMRMARLVSRWGLRLFALHGFPARVHLPLPVLNWLWCMTAFPNVLVPVSRLYSPFAAVGGSLHQRTSLCRLLLQGFALFAWSRGFFSALVSFGTCTDI